MESYRIDFGSLPWQTPLNGMRCKTIRRGKQQLRLVEYTPDMELHWCEKGHVGMVLEGQFEIRFEKETLIFNPHDGIFIPPGAEHKHMGKALTRTVRVVFVEETQ